MVRQQLAVSRREPGRGRDFSVLFSSLPLGRVSSACFWQVRRLLAEEIQQGWLEKWPGSRQDAEARWPGKVAMGKLALIECEGKDPRLVGDSKASGASPAARFPERAKHPRAVDVQTGLARLQEVGNLEADPWAAVTIDIKAAHKRMLLREEDAGLSFFTFLGVLYRFVTCHFGAGLSEIHVL